MIHVEQYGPVTVFRMARAFLGRPIYWTAAYLLDETLIDAGSHRTEQALVAAVERSLGSRSLRQIVITHGHEDHIGGLAALRRRFPTAPIYASRRTRALIEDPDRLAMQRYRRFLWGKPRPLDGVRLLDEIDNRVETPDYLLRAVETPGHSPDHVSFFEPTQRWLFSGDAFVGGRDQACSPEFDLFSTLGTLRMLSDLRPERIFPGSGHVRRTPQPELHEKIGYLKRLANEVVKLDALGMTAPEMVACLFDSEPPIRFWTGGHFSAANFIKACQSYNALFFADHPGVRKPGRNERLRHRDPDDPINRSAGS
jgi:glyoxylase-like metal-dependent hydrolase (beta-lactamase superfamily II)